MIWVDYCILAVILISLITGLLRGFAKEMLSLLTWGLAILLAWMFGDLAIQWLAPHISIPALRIVAAYSLLFLGGLLLGAVVASFVVQAIRNSRFSSADRTLGGGFGVIRGMVIAALFVLVAGTMGAAKDNWWQQSVFVPKLEWLADGLRVVVPESWLKLLRPDPAPQAPASSN